MKKQDLETWLTDHGWKRDRWGNFKKPSSPNKNKYEFRVKINKISARYETRAPDGYWFRISSAYYKAIRRLADDKLTGIRIPS